MSSGNFQTMRILPFHPVLTMQRKIYFNSPQNIMNQQYTYLFFTLAVRKKNTYQKAVPFSTHFLMYALKCYHIIITSYDRRKFLLAVFSDDKGQKPVGLVIFILKVIVIRF